MKLFISLAVTLFLSLSGIGQDLYDKIAKKVCKCAKQSKVENFDELDDCIVKNFSSHLPQLLEYHNKTKVEDIDHSEVGERLAGKIVKNCKYLSKLMLYSNQEKFPAFTPDDEINCSGLKLGDYYYLTPNEDGQFLDTTFVTFSEDIYLEKMKQGTTFSKLKIKWDDDCDFTLTFIESNDPLKESISKPGDKYKHSIIKNSDNSMVVSLVIYGHEYHIEYVKIKPE